MAVPPRRPRLTGITHLFLLLIPSLFLQFQVCLQVHTPCAVSLFLLRRSALLPSSAHRLVRACSWVFDVCIHMPTTVGRFAGELLWRSIRCTTELFQAFQNSPPSVPEPATEHRILLPLETYLPTTSAREAHTPPLPVGSASASSLLMFCT